MFLSNIIHETQLQLSDAIQSVAPSHHFATDLRHLNQDVTDIKEIE